MLKIYQKTIKEKKLSIIKEIKFGSWVHVERPDEKDLDFLVNKLALDKGLLEDALDEHEVPRMEIEKGNIYIFTRVPHKERNGHISTRPLLVVLGENFTVTFSRNSFVFFEKFEKEQIDFYTSQKTKFFLQIFSEINREYNKFLTDINKSVRQASIRLENIDNKSIVQFVVFEEALNDFLDSLVPISNILKNLLSGKSLKLYEDDEDLMEDLFLGNGQLIDRCKTNLKTMVNVREAYTAIMTNNLNRVIKLLTAITIILSVATLIASFYGMNVELPFDGSPVAFIWILLITSVISLVLFGIFIKNKWF